MKKQNLRWLFGTYLILNAPVVIAQEIVDFKNEAPIFNTISTEIPKNSTLSLHDYTWTDFVSEKNCQFLIQQGNDQTVSDELYQNLKPYCTTNEVTAWKDLMHLFRQEKRHLLLQQTLKKNSVYTRYFKIIPYLLFDIQKINDCGEQPIAILNQAQQAIENHQPEDYLALTKKLPDDWKKGLAKTELLAKRLELIKKQLNGFNQLKQKEESND